MEDLPLKWNFPLKCWKLSAGDNWSHSLPVSLPPSHRRSGFNSQLRKRERTGTSFLSWLDWKSKHFNWNVTEWKAAQPSLRVFSENCSNRSFAKVAKFLTNPYNFVACVPNPYKLSVSGDIWRATILPFFSSKYFYSRQRLKFSWSFIWISWFFKQTKNNHTLPQSSHISAIAYITTDHCFHFSSADEINWENA